MPKLEYGLVTGVGRDNLVREMNFAIQLHWRPHGGVSTYVSPDSREVVYVQAVVREKQESANGKA